MISSFSTPWGRAASAAWQTCFQRPGAEVLVRRRDHAALRDQDHQSLRGGKHPLFPEPVGLGLLLTITPAATWPATASCPSPSQKKGDAVRRVGRKVASGHHFLFEHYPYGTPVTTFTGKEDHSYLLRAFAKRAKNCRPAADAKLVAAAHQRN